MCCSHGHSAGTAHGTGAQGHPHPLPQTRQQAFPAKPASKEQKEVEKKPRAFPQEDLGPHLGKKPSSPQCSWRRWTGLWVECRALGGGAHMRAQAGTGFPGGFRVCFC